MQTTDHRSITHTTQPKGLHTTQHSDTPIAQKDDSLASRASYRSLLFTASSDHCFLRLPSSTARASNAVFSSRQHLHHTPFNPCGELKSPINSSISSLTPKPCSGPTRHSSVEWWWSLARVLLYAKETLAGAGLAQTSPF